MMQKDFAVERMKATLRIDKIESDLNETAQAIKDLNLENVGMILASGYGYLGASKEKQLIAVFQKREMLLKI